MRGLLRGATKSTVFSPSPAGKRATNLRFAGDLFFCAVLLNILQDLLRHIELDVNIAGVRVIGVRADLEILLGLPLQDLIAVGWVVAFLTNLLDHRPDLALVGVLVLGHDLH